MGDFVTKLFEVASDSLIGTGGLLKDGVKAIVDVIVQRGSDGSVEDLTIVGYCMAIGLGVGVIYFIFRLIKGWLNRVKG